MDTKKTRFEVLSSIDFFVHQLPYHKTQCEVFLIRSDSGFDSRTGLPNIS